MLEDEVDEKYYLSDKMVEYISFTGTKGYKNPDCKINLDVARPLTTDPNKRAGTSNYVSDVLPDNYDLRVIRKYGIFDRDGKTHQAGSVYDVEGLAPTLDTAQGGYRQPCIEDLKVLIKNDTKQGYLEAQDGDGIDISSRMQHHRGTVQKGMCQTITTSGGNERGVVVKETMKRQLCNELIASGVVKENDVIRHSYSHERMENWDERGVEANNMSPALTTRADTLGVVVKEPGSSYVRNFGSRGKLQNGEDVCDTLVAAMGTGGGNVPIVEERVFNLRIRKLTPKECWRLMGFDDEDFKKAESIPTSNAQLYKQAGNSIVVNVLQKLLANVLTIINKEEEEVKKVDEKKVITFETDKMIDLATLMEKEPELFEELVRDYPVENATYIFEVKKGA